VEGLTEFIPVSSTGHLILTGHLLGFEGDRAAAFEIFIQLGAVLAVVWEERRRIVAFACDLGRRGTGRRMAANLALGFLPSALLGLAIHDLIARVFFAPVFVGWGLLAGAVGILMVERLSHSPRVTNLGEIPARSALAVGLAQCLSLFPGVSRSAATILGGMSAGLDRRTATEFSFLLAIPTMFGASVYEVYRWRDTLGVSDVPGFAVGFLVAFVSGLAAVRFLLRYVATHDFRPFAWYRIAVGAIVLWVFWGA
jgi:undecaprenyl-diphosphatase